MAGGLCMTFKRASSVRKRLTVSNLAASADGEYDRLELFPTGKPVFKAAYIDSGLELIICWITDGCNQKHTQSNASDQQPEDQAA